MTYLPRPHTPNRMLRLFFHRGQSWSISKIIPNFAFVSLNIFRPLSIQFIYCWALDWIDQFLLWPRFRNQQLLDGFNMGSAIIQTVSGSVCGNQFVKLWCLVCSIFNTCYLIWFYSLADVTGTCNCGHVSCQDHIWADYPVNDIGLNLGWILVLMVQCR